MFEKGKAVVTPLRERGVREVVKSVLEDPAVVYRQFSNNRGFVKHRKEGPLAPSDIARFTSGLTGCSTEGAIDAWLELLDDERFRSGVENNLDRTDAGPSKRYGNWRELLYVLVRLAEPSTVVETGVADGFSSAYILAALSENGTGRLVSIDIGDSSVVPWDIDDREIGWMVPSYLEDRWDLRIGDSSTLLPDSLSRDVDLFFSDVPNEFLAHELDTASDRMATGGHVITSYPVKFPSERTWQEFADEHLKNVVTAPRAVYQETESVTCGGTLR